MRIKDVNRILREIRAGATHRGVIREAASPYKLLLDCDGAPRNATDIFSGLRRLGLKPRALYYAPSHTRGHWHIVIILCRPLSALAILFAQIYLGSDPERERNGFVRLVHHGRRDQYWQVLFEKKL